MSVVTLPALLLLALAASTEGASSCPQPKPTALFRPPATTARWIDHALVERARGPGGVELTIRQVTCRRHGVQITVEWPRQRPVRARAATADLLTRLPAQADARVDLAPLTTFLRTTRDTSDPEASLRPDVRVTVLPTGDRTLQVWYDIGGAPR